MKTRQTSIDCYNEIRVNDALNSFRELYKNKNISTVEDWKIVANLIKSI